MGDKGRARDDLVVKLCLADFSFVIELPVVDERRAFDSRRVVAEGRIKDLGLIIKSVSLESILPLYEESFRLDYVESVFHWK